MLLIIRLAFRNALRNVRRTLLTASTVLFGTAMLVLVMAWVGGIFGGVFKDATASIGHVRVIDPDYAAREQLMPLYENIPAASELAAEIETIEGVTAAYPVVRAGVAVSAGDELGDAFGLALGAPLEFFSDQLDIDSKIIDGGWFTDGKGEVVIGRRLAAKAGAEVGDEILLLGQTQDGSISPIKGTVVGIASAGYSLIDMQAFVTLEKMQWLTDIDDGAIELLVYGDNYEDAVKLAEEVRALPGTSGLQVQAWNEREPWAQMMGISGFIQAFVSAMLVFITALAIWNTMMMSVLERTGEIGVMRAMGLTGFGTVMLFVLEAMSIAVLGGIVGVALGSIPAYYLELNGITLGEAVTEKIGGDFAISATMYPDLTFLIIGKALLLGLVMAIFGAAVPAIRAAMIQPVTAMRARR